jgi:hypothetical protein
MWLIHHLGVRNPNKRARGALDNRGVCLLRGTRVLAGGKKVVRSLLRWGLLPLRHLR